MHSWLYLLRIFFHRLFDKIIFQIDNLLTLLYRFSHIHRHFFLRKQELFSDKNAIPNRLYDHTLLIFSALNQISTAKKAWHKICLNLYSN